MDKAAHRRHDISDRVWGLLEPHLPGRKGCWGDKKKTYFSELALCLLLF